MNLQNKSQQQPAADIDGAPMPNARRSTQMRNSARLIGPNFYILFDNEDRYRQRIART